MSASINASNFLPGGSDDQDLRYLYDTINTVIHKIDELRQMKINKDGQILLNILFKLNSEMIKGVDKFKDHFELLNHYITEQQERISKLEQNVHDIEENSLGFQYINNDLTNQVQSQTAEYLQFYLE